MELTIKTLKKLYQVKHYHSIIGIKKGITQQVQFQDIHGVSKKFGDWYQEKKNQKN
jgi:hypothetical protein